MGPIKYQEAPYPIDDPIDDRLKINNYDITLDMASAGIRALFTEWDLYPVARPLGPEGVGEPFIEDYVMSLNGPYNLLINALDERELYYDKYDQDLINELNLNFLSDISERNNREVAKMLPTPFTVKGRFVYDLGHIVKVTWKYSVYFNLLMITLPVQSKLEFFLEYQINQFPNGNYLYPKPFNSNEIVEVLDHAYFLDTLSTHLLKEKRRFEEMGQSAVYEKTQNWIEKKQEQINGRSLIGQKLLKGETVYIDDVEKLLSSQNDNNTQSQAHLTQFFKIKTTHVYNLFDLISGHADHDLKLISKSDEKEYIWTSSAASLSAFFAYLKEQLHIMQFSDKPEERKNLGISACTFFSFEYKEPGPDSFRYDKINREKHFSTFDQLFSNIERKINAYFDIKSPKDLRKLK